MNEVKSKFRLSNYYLYTNFKYKDNNAVTHEPNHPASTFN
jgi:hypothetical protein